MFRTDLWPVRALRQSQEAVDQMPMVPSSEAVNMCEEP